MALLWMDGFDHYSDNDQGSSVNLRFLGIYTSEGNRMGISTMPELGGRALLVNRSAESSTMRFRKAFETEAEVLGFGCHVYIDTLTTDLNLPGFCTSTGAKNVFVGSDQGNFALYSGSSTGNLLASTDVPVEARRLYHLELSVERTSTGYAELRIDGVTVARVENTNFSSVTSFGTSSKRGTGGTIGGGIFFVDNLYFWDDGGAVNNSWLGERNIYTLFPVADGPDQDWVPSVGSDGYALINSVPPGSEYIEASTVGDISSFFFEDLPTTDITIIGVQTGFTGTKTGTAASSVSIGPGSTRGESYPLTQDQDLKFSDIYELNPDTGEGWSPAEVNNLLVEIERTE